MHQLVTLIVDGTDKKAALRNAESCAQDMCEEGSDYDWYNMNGRWGESEAVRADSITGAALIKAAMDKQGANQSVTRKNCNACWSVKTSGSCR